MSAGPLRVCVIGNSHLAALRGGWDLQGASFPNIVPTWFGAVRDGLKRLRRSGGVLRATSPEVKESLAWTSGGLHEIVIADYDAFLLVGLGLSFVALARIYRDYRTVGQSDRLRKRHLISASAFEAAASGSVRDSLGMTLGRIIRGATSVPIIVAADPLPGESALQSKEASLWQHLSTDPDGPALFSLFAEMAEREASSADLVFMQQPLETRSVLPFTKDALRRGAVRILPTGTTPMNEEDVGHMGPDYGVAMLAAACAHFGVEYGRVPRNPSDLRSAGETQQQVGGWKGPRGA